MSCRPFRSLPSLLLPLSLLGAMVGSACGTETASDDTAGMPNDGDDDDDGSTSFNPGDGPGNSDSGGGTLGDDDDDDDDDDDADGDGFIMPPDGGVTGQCDPASQDCPKGEKCTSYVAMPGGTTVDSTKCVPEMGDAVAGEPCVREAENDDCAAGFFCMTDVSGNTGDGFCLEYCDVMSMVCEFGGECFGFNDGALPVCEVTCDPLLQDCPGGQGCYAAFESFVCAFPGFPDGQGNDGDECFTIQGCNSGLACRSGTAGCAEGVGCCTPFCPLSNGGAECDDPSEECVAALDNPPPSYVDVGYCGLPPA